MAYTRLFLCFGMNGKRSEKPKVTVEKLSGMKQLALFDYEVIGVQNL